MQNILLTLDEAANLLSIGKTKLYSEISNGNIAATKLGRRTLVKRENLDEYVAKLENYPAKN